MHRVLCSSVGPLVRLVPDVARGCEGVTQRWDICDLGTFTTPPSPNPHPGSDDLVSDPRQNYSELRFPKYPTLTPLLTHFFQGSDRKTSIGPYWQQPGRSILEQHLVAIPDARDVAPSAFKDFVRSYLTGSMSHPSTRPCR